MYLVRQIPIQQVDSLHNIVADCLNKSVKFLISQFKKDFGWADFLTNSSGESTSWITGHVLCQAGELLPKSLVNEALQVLLEQKNKNGGWGFSPKTPVDCDSTMHVASAIRKFNPQYVFEDTTKNFILSHQLKNGGFTTYGDESILALYRNKKNDIDYSGWTNSHNCVTAFALKVFDSYPELIHPQKVLRMKYYLLQNQRSHGYWNSYWWHSKYFSTTKIIPVFYKSKIKRLNSSGRLALNWVINTFNDKGYWDNGYSSKLPCIISTACCIKGLIQINQRQDIVKKSLLWLIKNQNPDGSWKSNPILCIPEPHLKEPDEFINWQMDGRGTGSITSDNNRVYTTSTVIGALCKILNL